MQSITWKFILQNEYQQDATNLTVSCGMLRQLPKIKIPRCSASVFYGDRHKFVQPIPPPPSFSLSRGDLLSLPLAFLCSRLLADLWAYRFFLLQNLPGISRRWSSALTIGRTRLPVASPLLLFPTIFSTVIPDSFRRTYPRR